MLKTMFLDNWFSSLLGIGAATLQYRDSGMSWAVAALAAFGIASRDGIPGLSKLFGAKAAQ